MSSCHTSSPYTFCFGYKSEILFNGNDRDLQFHILSFYDLTNFSVILVGSHVQFIELIPDLHSLSAMPCRLQLPLLSFLNDSDIHSPLCTLNYPCFKLYSSLIVMTIKIDILFLFFFRGLILSQNDFFISLGLGADGSAITATAAF